MLEPIVQISETEKSTFVGEANQSPVTPIHPNVSPIEAFDRETEMLREQGNPRRATHPEVPALLTNAKILIQNDELTLAQEIIRAALRHDSYHPEAIRLLGGTFMRMEKWQEAAHCFQQLIEVEADDRSLALLAEACYQVGDDDKALELYLSAMLRVEYEGSSLFDIFKNVGNIHVRAGDFEAAEEYYNKAYTLHPESDVLLVNYGTLEIQKDDMTKALHRFRQALNKNADNDKAWVGLALIHHQFGDFDLSWANIEKALDSNPYNRTALQLMAQWAPQFGKTEHVLTAFDVYSEQKGFDLDMSLLRAHLLSQSKRWIEARIECELILMWEPTCEAAQKLVEEVSAHA